MIVVDTNVIAYLFLPGDYTANARQALREDSEWAAPLLWRTELRSVLATYLRRGDIRMDDALRVIELAADLLRGNEFAVDSDSVLRLAARSTCRVYDCELVALAQGLGVRLVTTGGDLLDEFSPPSVSLARFVA